MALKKTFIFLTPQSIHVIHDQCTTIDFEMHPNPVQLSSIIAGTRTQAFYFSSLPGTQLIHAIGIRAFILELPTWEIRD